MLTYRDATIDDLDQIVAIYNSTFPQEWLLLIQNR
jgi:L-amino acid N-acyltransferase YncA